MTATDSSPARPAARALRVISVLVAMAAASMAGHNPATALQPASAPTALARWSAPGLRPPGGPYLPPALPLRVVAGFDPPAQRWQSGHRGVDLAAAEGAPVRAAGAGRVVFAGTVVDRGVVTIDHAGLRTTYEPVAPTVAAGQPVAAGDVIGSVAAGAHCSQRCLHWGALLDEQYIDPMALLTSYRPVLKPPK